VQSSLAAIAMIIAAMTIVTLLELAIPLHRRGRWNNAHLAPNLVLTAITFATNALFNVALLMALVWLERRRFGLLPLLALPPLAAGALAVVVLDLSFYVAHLCMHHTRWLWRVHRVHHSDPAVDVTTTIRQHPAEGVVRYAFMATFAMAVGASPSAFAVYRVWSVLNGLLEHANLRMPRRLDELLAVVITTPNMHKVHHSRAPSQTDTNYGNIFSVFDRLFATFTPTALGETITYGLDGFDDPCSQTTIALLVEPVRRDIGPLLSSMRATRGKAARGRG
jgi:sterol desaturase/sphingolipid hydroxylase (fatty acid hydroxylase superfamily)